MNSTTNTTSGTGPSVSRTDLTTSPAAPQPKWAFKTRTGALFGGLLAIFVAAWIGFICYTVGWAHEIDAKNAAFTSRGVVTEGTVTGYEWIGKGYGVVVSYRTPAGQQSATLNQFSREEAPVNSRVSVTYLPDTGEVQRTGWAEPNKAVTMRILGSIFFLLPVGILVVGGLSELRVDEDDR